MFRISEGEDEVTLAFASPEVGAAFVRDELGAYGALVARVEASVAVTGAPARVGLAAGGAEITLEDGAGALELPAAGAATLVATAYDADGAALATAAIDVTVADPTPAGCHGWLDLYRVDYTVAAARAGVADPITAAVPLNGLSFRAVGGSAPRTSLFGDCALIVSLAQAAAVMRARDIVEIADYGIYNYRCINGGTPPDCPSGISQHAYATAIDLAGFTLADDTYVSVNDDWVIDPAGEPTCEAETEPGKDRFLHELICTLKAAGTWNIVLTPNYNAAHRNHFHVDLTPGADFIRRRR